MKNDFGLSEEMAKNSCGQGFPPFTLKLSIKNLAYLNCLFDIDSGVWDDEAYDDLPFSEVKRLVRNAVEYDVNVKREFRDTQGTAYIEINGRYELKAWVENGNSEKRANGE